MSDAFYDWRDFSEGNISFLKELMESPLKKIYDWAGEVYWCDDWGDEPEDEAKRVAFIRGKIPDAPRLIPIYSHRYVAWKTIRFCQCMGLMSFTMVGILKNTSI